MQGVGFRPFVHQVAKRFDLNGEIKNGSDGLHIHFNSSAIISKKFYACILNKAPKNAVITFSEILETAQKAFVNFSIVLEENSAVINVLLSPDLSPCAECLQEMNDPANRRYQYPFITCTCCGPRYSIIKSLPYERINTTMCEFEMCAKCRAEYNDTENRRYFSQTNSCGNCGIKMKFHFEDGATEERQDKIIEMALQQLKDGKIVAVKGGGGYLLLCDAANETAIELLRKRKHRPTKPFALLYPNIEKIFEHYILNKTEEELILNSASPIVLLKPSTANDLSLKLLAPGLNRLGVMLPSTALLSIISNKFSKPLIATSGNISGSPILYKDEEALIYLFDIADSILSYNRAILMPQDDSVLIVAPGSLQRIFIRRSRGYAPAFLNYVPKKKEVTIATGAHLKAGFLLSANGNIFASQFLGNAESFESREMYETTLLHWLKMYQIQPTFILTDKHPQYFSHLFAHDFSQNNKVPVAFIQHHEAHFAAILAEHELQDSEMPVLGIIWDGTGLGYDGNIWGGEFFKIQNNKIIRLSHFENFPVIAGDKMAGEPRLSASSLNAEENLIKFKFSETEWKNYEILKNDSSLFTSSAGRLFDAVACLLRLGDVQSYEGEVAAYLQVLAETYVNDHGFDLDSSYLTEDMSFEIISTFIIMKNICSDIRNGVERSFIAAKFHFTLVQIVALVAKKFAINKICFSGGVFQNSLLVDWMHYYLKSENQLYFHSALSPNDENISFGQFVFFDNDLQSVS